ncbi:MAG: DUF5777 family beta-barrel protein [bacterium]
MNKPVIKIVTALFIGAAVTPAFERDMLNLETPSGLEAGNGVIELQHRFKGPVDYDPAGTILGMKGGANVHLGFRYCPWRRLEFRPALTFGQKEYTLGASYSLRFTRFAETKFGVEFFSYDVPEIKDRRQNFFYNLSFQGEPILGVISPALVVGYDGYEERVGTGLGVAVGFDREGLFKHIALIGEYYPVFARDEERTGPEDCFAAGVEAQTYGHHFALLVGNSSQIGTRRLMLGADTNDLYLGFNIYRLIEF